jgi:hypothetical protein
MQLDNALSELWKRQDIAKQILCEDYTSGADESDIGHNGFLFAGLLERIGIDSQKTDGFFLWVRLFHCELDQRINQIRRGWIAP